MTAKTTAEEYVAGVRARDPGRVAAVFAEDGCFRPPPPELREFRGREAIRGYYEEFLTRVEPTVHADYVLEGDRCVVTLDVDYPSGRRSETIDVFTVNDRDEVVDMVAYRRRPWDGSGPGG